MRRSSGPADGRAAKAARARNSGSSPRLNSARPPDFTNMRLEMVTLSSFSVPCPPDRPTARPPSPSLKLRPPDREPGGQGPRLKGVLDVGQLRADDPFRVLRHRPPQNRAIDVRDELLRIRGGGSHGVQGGDRAR